MNTSGMGHRDRFERISSSGIVFSEKPAVKGNSNNSQINGILFRLIEEEIELTFRSQNCLNNAGIKLIGQLVQKSASELLNLKNFGRRSLHEIEDMLSEMDLTLEMNLDFPPWNGNSNDSELIHILSLQRVGGGFLIDHNAVQLLGGDSEKMNQEMHDALATNNSEGALIIFTRHLLHRLETHFEKEMSSLTNLIGRHRIWLQKKLKKGNL